MISKTFVELTKHCVSFFDGESSSGNWSWLGLSIGLAATIKRGSRNVQCATRSYDPHSLAQLLGSIQSVFSGGGVCIISETFF